MSTHQLDHTDMPQMLIEQGIQRVCDQRARQEQDQDPKRQQNAQDGVDRIGQRMFVRLTETGTDDDISHIFKLVF